jgi:tetratricopeptide (TPR) repeat protein/transcriptional regulator with XRE-family HTH domain
MAQPRAVTFAELLKRYRQAAGLTQEELAERAGLSLRGVGDLERGARRAPRKDTVALLGTALALAPDDLALLEAVARRQRLPVPAAVPAVIPSSMPPHTEAELPLQGNFAPPLTPILGREHEEAVAVHPVPHKETIPLVAPSPRLSPSTQAPHEGVAGRARVSDALSAAGATPLAGDTSAMASAPTAPPLPLVGRATQLDVLARHLAGEEPPLLLLAGEPGMGKSRLLAAAARRARQWGWTVLEGGCTRRSGQEPYAPLLGALAGYVAARSPAALRADLESCAWLVRLLPELAELAVVPAPVWALPPEQERRLMFAAVRRFIANVAGPQGTLLVLDDLQWAGADALDLLNTLIRSSASVSLRVVGAYRSSEVRPQDPLAVTLADLASAGLASQQRLGPLAPQEASALLQHVLAQSKAPSTNQMEQVLARTSGVPFFLVSCAEALREGTLAREQEAVPWTVAQSIRQRVAALPMAAQEMLGVAAVIGRQVERSILFAVSAQLGQVERLMLEVMEATHQAHLLVEAGEDAYQFPHDLIREVIVTDLSAARRASLHRRVAEALEASLGEPPIERLAYHYQRTGQTEKAIQYLERAGDRAWAMHANQEAVGYYFDLLARLVRLGRPLDEARVAEKLSKVMRIQGDYEQALEFFQQAADAYQRGDDREGQWRVVVEMGWVYFRRGMYGEGLAHLRPLIAAAERSAPPRQLVAVLNLLAAHERNTGQHRAALNTIGRTMKLARALGETVLQIAPPPAVSFGRLLLDEGRVEEALQVIEEILPLVEHEGDLANLASCLRIPAAGYLLRGEFAKSREYRERALAIVERRKDQGYTVFQLSARGRLSFLSGDWHAARADAERAVTLYRQFGAVGMPPQPLLLLGELSLVEGRWEEARALLVEGLRCAEHMGEPERLVLANAVFAEWELVDGQPQAAWIRLESLLDPPDREEIFLIQLWTLLAWAAVDLGMEAQADTYLQQALQRARTYDLRFALVAPLRTQAWLAIRQERWTDALAALEEALGLCRAMPYPYAEAKALYVSGLLHRARGKPDRACERWKEALAICNRLGEGLYRPYIERALADVMARDRL